jgi:hypothetical protein
MAFAVKDMCVSERGKYRGERGSETERSKGQVFGSKYEEVPGMLINILKPSGKFTYHQKLYVVLTLHLCVLYGSQKKQQFLPYKALRDWFL